MTRWRHLFQRGRCDRELDAELRDHVERRIADLEKAGIAAAEARRRALAEFGGLDQAKEYCRDVRRMRWAEDLATDVRYALRMLAHSRTFTLVAVLSLALGIGANTAIFSLVNSLLLRTLPVAEPERLASLEGNWTNPIWEQVRARQSHLFEHAAAWSFDRMDMSRGGQAQPVQGVFASGEFFDVFGVRPILGRAFTTANDRRGGGADQTVAVISYGFWQRHFGGAADVVGRTLTLNRAAFTVIGVMPPEFLGPSIGRTFDLIVPVNTLDVLEARGAEHLDHRGYWWLDITARLRPGQTLDDATAAVRAIQPQVREATMPTHWPEVHQEEYLREPFTVISAAQGPSGLRDQLQQPLAVIMGVVGLVLLIACANIANLMLARATGRAHELTMRLALGASRGRLARQLVTESLLLSAIGAALGLWFARWGSDLLVAEFSTPRDPLVLDLSLDWRVLAFTAGVAVLTALIFGAAPALTTRRLAPMDALKEQGRGRGGARHRLAGPLVVAQIALSVVLVVGAGLFLRTFTTLATQDLGFDPDKILIVDLDTQRSRVPAERRASLFVRLAEAAARVPGVERTAASHITPVSGGAWSATYDVLDRHDLSPGERSAFVNAISPGWHSLYGTRLVAGREFTDRDSTGAPRVVIVNEAFARKFLRAGTPLGQVAQPSYERDGVKAPGLEVVGVVENTAGRSLREEWPPAVFVPMAQVENLSSNGAVSVLAAVESPATLARSLAGALTEVDPDVTLSFRLLSEQVGARMVRERVLAILGGFFGALALLLSAVGLYGVTAYSVNLRRAEIGIRMALGADVARVLRLVLGRSTRLVVIGVAIGVGLSLWLATFVGPLLYGLEPRDTTTLVTAIVVMLVIGTAAAFIPAWRAARLEPVKVLREG